MNPVCNRGLNSSFVKVNGPIWEIQWFHSLSSCQIGWIWGYACDGGDVCDWSLAKSAAHVHDAKPEGDVHSILSNPFNLTSFIPSHFHAVRNEARGGSVTNPAPKPSASKQPVLSRGFVQNPVPKPRWTDLCATLFRLVSGGFGTNPEPRPRPV